MRQQMKPDTGNCGENGHAYIGLIEFVVAKITSAKIQVAPAKISKDVFNYLM